MTKYLNTRDGSIEDATVKTFEKNITFEKKEIKLEAPKNRYLDTRETSLEAAVTKVVTENTMWEDSAKEQAEIKEKAKYMKAEMGDYQAKFKKELEKTGKSISQMSDDEKKKFFDKMDSKHKADNEAVDPETLTNLRNKISDTTAKVSKVDRTGARNRNLFSFLVEKDVCSNNSSSNHIFVVVVVIIRYSNLSCY